MNNNTPEESKDTLFYFQTGTMEQRHYIDDVLTTLGFRFIDATGSQQSYQPGRVRDPSAYNPNEPMTHHGFRQPMVFRDGDFQFFCQAVNLAAQAISAPILRLAHVRDPGLGLFGRDDGFNTCVIRNGLNDA